MIRVLVRYRELLAAVALLVGVTVAMWTWWCQ